VTQKYITPDIISKKKGKSSKRATQLQPKYAFAAEMAAIRNKQEGTAIHRLKGFRFMSSRYDFLSSSVNSMKPPKFLE
jgi:hypothetical protein